MSCALCSVLPCPLLYTYTNNAIKVGPTRSFSRCKLYSQPLCHKLTYTGLQRCMSTLPVPNATNDKWSNPIGLPSGPLSFQDLFSLDPEFLQFIPKPVKAVLLLFPCRGELAEARKKEEEDGEGKFTGDVWWIKQTVSLSPYLRRSG
jgi:hypothetical protein